LLKISNLFFLLLLTGLFGSFISKSLGFSSLGKGLSLLLEGCVLFLSLGFLDLSKTLSLLFGSFLSGGHLFSCLLFCGFSLLLPVGGCFLSFFLFFISCLCGFFGHSLLSLLLSKLLLSFFLGLNNLFLFSLGFFKGFLHSSGFVLGIFKFSFGLGELFSLLSS